MKQNKSLVVVINSHRKQDPADIHVFLFNKDGQLAESAPVKEGRAKLKSKPADVSEKARLFVGPKLPSEIKSGDLTPEVMKKIGAFEAPMHISVENEITIVGIPKIPAYFFDWCLITGNLSKTFSIDGQDKVLPVCDARVHICAVDRFPWWWQIPIHIIDQLGAKLREAILNPLIAVPPHGPGPDPGPLSILKIAQSRPAPLSSAENARRVSETPSLLTPLPAEVKNALLSSSPAIVRDTIYRNFHFLHPYLCLWPWLWPYFYFCREIGVAYTDCNGRFSFDYLNFTHEKNYYVWVEVCINGQWVTVYRPPIPCGTKWNYACGTDISIKITDPRVMPCSCGQHLQGELVWFRSVGESATALHIEQADASAAVVQGLSMRNVGCTDVVDPARISPFASTLAFKLLFGDGMPTGQITHYRWKKTQLKDSVLNDVSISTPSVVNGLVQKTYYVITTDINGHMHFETKAVTLGAEGSGGNVGYRIPHWDIYQDPGVPAADKNLTIQWTSPDFWSASVDSNSLADGLWRFDLELLTLDNTGTFQVAKVATPVFQVSDYDNSGDSVDAPLNYLRLDGANPPAVLSLSVKLRIDNAPCVADIQDATIDNNGTTEYSGRCGFLNYSNVNQKTHISFIASHPRNFATFTFSVVKGNNTENPGINQGGYVGSSVGLYSLVSGIFSADVPVSQLLGTCPQAAFGENLSVQSLATDGSRRISEYDRSDSNAFALSMT